MLIKLLQCSLVFLTFSGSKSHRWRASWPGSFDENPATRIVPRTFSFPLSHIRYHIIVGQPRLCPMRRVSSSGIHTTSANVCIQSVGQFEELGISGSTTTTPWTSSFFLNQPFQWLPGFPCQPCMRITRFIKFYSTVTLFARFRGLSIFLPSFRAV